jgi:DNA repair exonuclease SbcCD nuclease subunit
MVTILCSADWQLGMRRRFFSAEAQNRYTQARIDVIDHIAALVGSRGVDAVVVAGDVFDANRVDRRVVLRAAESLGRVGCPVYLLPGNHDSLEPGSVWASAEWRAVAPPNVHVLTDTAVTVGVGAESVEIVGAPWRSRRPAADPLTGPESGLLTRLEPATTPRVVVAHGQVDTFPGTSPLPPVAVSVVEAALTDGRADLVVLGDRHSTTSVGASDRIWYPGTPEVTDTDESAPGNVLLAELGADRTIDVETVPIGSWHMLDATIEFDGAASVDAFDRWLGDLPDKPRTFVRLHASGALGLDDRQHLELVLDAAAQVLAGIQRQQWDVQPVPDDAALDALGLAGAVREAMLELRSAALTGDVTAANALTLLHRLTVGAA